MSRSLGLAADRLNYGGTPFPAPVPPHPAQAPDRQAAPAAPACLICRYRSRQQASKEGGNTRPPVEHGVD